MQRQSCSGRQPVRAVQIPDGVDGFTKCLAVLK